MNASLIGSIATVLIPLLFPIAIALAAVLYMSLLQKLPMQQRLIVCSMAHTIVRAVEQMMPSDAPGAQKKDQALHALVTILDGVGLKVPAPLLETAIEAAVFELHTLYPHGTNDAPPSDLEGPFPSRPTLRSLPAVQLGVSPTTPTAQLPRDPAPSAPTEPIPLPLTTEKRPS